MATPEGRFDDSDSGVTPSYLALRVGPYRLAVPTELVRSVSEQVPLLAEASRAVGAGALSVQQVELGGEPIPLIDFAQDSDQESAQDVGRAKREIRCHRVPFAVAVELEGGTVALGADRVDYLALSQRLVVPRFGLRHPHLFEGALRAEGEVWLILAPRGLARLLESG